MWDNKRIFECPCHPAIIFWTIIVGIIFFSFLQIHSFSPLSRFSHTNSFDYTEDKTLASWQQRLKRINESFLFQLYSPTELRWWYDVFRKNEALCTQPLIAPPGQKTSIARSGTPCWGRIRSNYEQLWTVSLHYNTNAHLTTRTSQGCICRKERWSLSGEANEGKQVSGWEVARKSTLVELFGE